MSGVITRSDRQARVVEVWRANGRREGTICQYLWWVQKFEQDEHSAGPERQLTLSTVEVFAADYAQRRGIDRADAVRRARAALRAWSRGLERCGEQVPEWALCPPVCTPSPLLAEFRDFRLRHAGVAASTVACDLRLLSDFLDVVVPEHRGAHGLELTLEQVDEYVTDAGSRWSRKTSARFCSSLRSFLRFLHHRGYMAHDPAQSVAAPAGPSQSRS